MKRRQSLGLLGSAVLTGTAGALSAQSPAATPAHPEGPYYPVEPIPLRADLTRRTSQQAQGTPLVLHGRVARAGQSLPAARVEIWQCDAKGHYRHPQSSPAVDPGWEGFGAQITDAQGLYTFNTILPVPYESRPPHVHFKVWLGGALLLTTQAYLEGQTREGGALGWLWALFSSSEGLTMKPASDANGAVTARFDILLA